MKSRPTHQRFGFVVAVLAAVTASTAAAEHNPDDVLARLGHDQWSVRQEAWRLLLADQTLTDQQIDEMFAAARSCEQRRRLIDVARHHTLRRIVADKVNKSDKKTACLGVSLKALSPSRASRTVPALSHITDTHPGLPGFIWFVPGDIAVDGKKHSTGIGLGNVSFLVKAIASHQPGDVVTITVLRDGVTLDVSVKLADMVALTELYSPRQGVDQRIIVVGRGLRQAVPQVRSSVALKPQYRKLWQQRYRQLVRPLTEVDDVVEESAADTH